MRETWNLCYVGSVKRETWNLCYVGSVNAGDLELVLSGFRKCERLGTCVMWVPGDKCGKCGRLGTCVMWVP